uniref:Uncharacterized protein n=1 Tax=Arundo donax TaxID=35708 RepID=A0A0A9BN60_ARUDO
MISGQLKFFSKLERFLLIMVSEAEW